MTVCTNDVALGDLGENGLPGAVAQALRDVEALLSEMVELEDERVGLSAIDARSIAKESHEVHGALCRDRSLAAERVCDVALAMRRIVFVLVVGPTRSAVVVALFASLPAPGEVREWLCLSAAAA
jgi:hypothetical protein